MLKNLTDMASPESLEQSGSAEKGKLDASAPRLNLGRGFFADAGETQLTWSALVSTGPGMIVLAGVALVVLGIVLIVWLKMSGPGWAFVVAGGAVIAIGVTIERWPWLFPILLALPVVFGIYVAVHAWRAKQATTTATVIATGVQNGSTIGPADLSGLPTPITADQYPLVQSVIDATIRAIKAKVQAGSEAAGGVVRQLLTKMGL